MAVRSASCIRCVRRPQTRSGRSRWPRRRAASGSFSAPSTAINWSERSRWCWTLPLNQPHRAEIVKMMTRVSHRGRGVAKALLHAAERAAIEHGRWLLVLDTADDEGASGLYERVGFKLAGIIPDYAYKPHGGLTGTMFYWKRLQDVACPA